MILKLLAILKVANALDRSHKQKIKNVCLFCDRLTKELPVIYILRIGSMDLNILCVKHRESNSLTIKLFLL